MLLMLLAAAATAQPAPPATDQDKDPVVCQRQNVGLEVGTHMRPKKVCMKKSEWDLVEKNTQRELKSFSDRSAFDPGRAGTPR